MRFATSHILFVLINLIAFQSCNTISNKVEIILLFKTKPENFETLNNEEIKSLPNSTRLNSDEFIKMMNESTNEGAFLLVKGGWHYVVLLYENGTNKKLRLSCAYGIYQDLNSKHYFKIKGDASLGNGLCDKFILD